MFKKKNFWSIALVFISDNHKIYGDDQCCPKRFIDTMNMRLLWTTTPSKLFWAPFIPLQLALAEV